MKKLFLFPLLTFIILMSSCDKYPDKMTITINRQGTVLTTVLDKDKLPVEGAEVSINNNGSGWESDNWKGITDSSGKWKSESLLEGNYNFYATLKKGKVTYYDRKLIQVIAGQEKTLTLEPFSNSGDVTLAVTDYYGEAINDINVSLIQYYQEFDIENIQSVAHFTGVTNSNGIVKFTDIPVEVQYRAVVYDNQRIFDVSSNSVNSTKGEVIFQTVRIYNYN